MGTGRLEAFSDGVIAIIITIMVLEIRQPQGSDFNALMAVLPTFLTYILSFSVLGIYWNNHHHLLHAANSITTGIMWANLHLLFWLSLIPFATEWLGQDYQAATPTVLYGLVMLLCGISYIILQNEIVKHQDKNSILRKKLGKDIKGKLSLGGYAIATIFGSINPSFSDIVFVAIAIMWFIPDRRLL